MVARSPKPLNPEPSKPQTLNPKSYSTLIEPLKEPFREPLNPALHGGSIHQYYSGVPCYNYSIMGP